MTALLTFVNIFSEKNNLLTDANTSILAEYPAQGPDLHNILGFIIRWMDGWMDGARFNVPLDTEVFYNKII